MNANDNACGTLTGPTNKIAIFFGFAWNEVVGSTSGNPIYQVGKTIPGYISYEPGSYRKFHGTDFLGLYERGVWKKTEV